MATDAQVQMFREIGDCIDNGYIPHVPFDKQWKILTDEDTDDILIGGAAGGSKSQIILMGALQYIHKPDYNALIIRRTTTDLKQPDSILDRCERWLTPHITNDTVHYDRINKIFTFPSGSKLKFGYLQNESDLYTYQGAQYQFIGIDESSQLPEKHLKYLHSRLRQSTIGEQIPLRFWMASNPGGKSNDFLRDNYVEGPLKFYPMSYRDNPYIDDVEYEKQLNLLDELTRRQLMFGDWRVAAGSWFILNSDQYDASITSMDDKVLFSVCGVDMAGQGKDRFAMSLISYLNDGRLFVSDIDATEFNDQEIRLQNFLERNNDKNIRLVAIEKEPASSPEFALKYFRKLLKGYNVQMIPPTGSKFNRAKPVGIDLKNKELFINNTIEEKMISELKNEFGYIHFEKKEMSKYPSPDILDSLGYAFIGIKNIINNKTKIGVA